jgi:hypothetical protein
MEKNKLELVLATIFFIIGVFLLILSPGKVTVSGASGGVVGVGLTDTASEISMFFGLIMVCFSAWVYVSSGGKNLNVIVDSEYHARKENVMPLRDVASYIMHITPEKEKRVIVLDTGFFIHNKNPVQVDEFLGNYAQVYTTHEAFNSIGEQTKVILRKHRCKLFNEAFITEHSPETDKYLMDSDKARLFENLYPYLRKDNPRIPGTRAEQTGVVNHFKELLARMQSMSDGVWNLNTAAAYDDKFRSEARKYLEKLCPVSPGDKEVVVVAFKLASQKDSSVFVYSLDGHIKDAVKRIRDERPEIKEHLRYLDVA